MKNPICFILFLLLSQSLSAGTNITGALAESLYKLIPNKPVRHPSPRLMDIKVLAIGFYCAERINEDNSDYKCLLPNKNNDGKIDVTDEAAKILFEALSSNQESAEKLSENLSCCAHGEPDSITYKCVITS